MATVGQIYYNVVDTSGGGYMSSGPNIFNDLIPAVGAKSFTKLGIQAPPGTKIVMNDNKTIMVGRTGIYELDDEISITHMYFIRPRNYIKDEAASTAAKKAGVEGMIAANNQRQASLNSLNTAYPDIPTNEFLSDGVTPNPNYVPYWTRYNEIQSIYIEQYNEALSKFNTGSNGIYVLPNPDNENAPENFQDLYNVIIDYLFE